VASLTKSVDFPIVQLESSLVDRAQALQPLIIRRLHPVSFLKAHHCFFPHLLETLLSDADESPVPFGIFPWFCLPPSIF